MKRLILVLLILSLVPFVTADEFTSMCVTENGCTPGLPQGVCLGMGSADPAYPKWYPAGASASEYAMDCELVQCDVDNVCSEMERIACSTTGGTEDGPACSGTVTPTCGNGESDCICGGILVTPDDDPVAQWCCNAQVVETQECGSTPGEPTEATCGDGIKQDNELCDGDNLGVCESFSGVEQGCTQNCRCLFDPNDYNATDGTCEPGEDCTKTVECVENSPKPVLTVSSITATDKALAEWSVDILEACESTFSGQFTLEFTEQGGTPASSPTTNDLNATFTVESEKVYDVRVGAIYDSGTVWSDSVTFTAGHEDCFRSQRAWCDEEANQVLVICTADNTRQTQNCNPGRCYPTILDGEPFASCEDPVDCDMCNGPYDSFGEVRGSKSQTINFGDISISKECQDLDSISTEHGEVTFCYLDQTYSALKQYVDCSTTGWCIDYGTKESCADDPCNVRGTCIWNTTVGLCTAKEPGFQKCSSETELECQAEGTGCFWQVDRCVTTTGGICEYFEEEQECTGGTDFLIDQNTNEYLATSQNGFGLPKCVWDPVEDECFKDANSDNTQDPIEYARDFINPSTALVVPPASIEWGADIEIPYITSEPGTTYAELIPGDCGQITRPGPEGANNVDTEDRVFRFTNLETGTYCLQYYTRDRGYNMEFVKQATLHVNAEQLAVEDVEFFVEPWFDRLTADVDAYVTLSRYAYCDIMLYGDSGALWPRMEGAWGNNFHLVFRDLPDGQYELETSCWLDTGGEANSTNVLLLDIDSRITQPIPPIGTYLNAQVAWLGIHTKTSDASCSYIVNNNPVPFTGKTPRTINGESYTLHYTDAPTLESGFHTFPVTCEFSDGMDVIGGAADTIAFAIDETPPTTTIWREVDGVPVQYMSSVEAGASGTDITIRCEDESIPGRNKQWESGCAQTFIDRGNGFSGVPLADDEATVSVEAGDTLKIYSVDNLGNKESTFTLQVVLNDISGPERPVYTVIP